MTLKVVDASAAAALLFGEPDAEAVAARLDGAELRAPFLPPFEVASVAWKKIRMHPRSRAAILAAFDLLPRLNIEPAACDHSATLRLADERGMTVYDAAYLWLARELDAELVTLDRKLEKAAKTL
jgi:predicted nucleic acid-binding protein